VFVVWVFALFCCCVACDLRYCGGGTLPFLRCSGVVVPVVVVLPPRCGTRIYIAIVAVVALLIGYVVVTICVAVVVTVAVVTVICTIYWCPVV